MADPSERFAHGDFWDRYSQSWESEVKPRIEGEILGEEWTHPERTRFVYERFASPYLSPSARVVEIGPGGGKFSRRLVEQCRELLLVDISREMLQRANRVIGGRAREVLIDDGQIDGVASASVDLVFSYDVFIHLESEEVFRYLAEVNRILKTGGVFSVHTSSFESRWGMHSYFQQVRDHQPLIGQRYGGRMYPMSAGILRRLAEHSGFSVRDAHADRDDKDIIFALRKTRPARPWAFLTTPDLYRRYELSERIGGSDRRELYAGLSLASGQPVILAVGDCEDRLLIATAAAEVPRHPCLAAPRGWDALAGVGIVRYSGQRPHAIATHCGENAGSERPGELEALGRLLEGLLEAHGSGLAHGELGSGFVLGDSQAEYPQILGWVDRCELPDADACERDLAAIAPILAAAATANGVEELAEIARQLGRDPNETTAVRTAEKFLA